MSREHPTTPDRIWQPDGPDDDFPDLGVFARQVAEEIAGEPLDEQVRLIREAMEYIVTVERKP